MNAKSCFFQNDSQEDGGPITVSTSLPPIIWRLDEGSPLAVSAAPTQIKVEIAILERHNCICMLVILEHVMAMNTV
jgi:hypothetical protein